MDETLSSTEEFAQRHAASRRLRNRLAIAASILLVVVLLLVMPPLLNVSRYQRRIVSTMSASLGRPVHLDKVQLHLLPVPGLTLTNLVVSEDPQFGAEPTIRANSVEATLRVSSLWRRQIEFSRVRFIDPSLNLVRDPQGKWNFENILMHASHIDAAPTSQKRHGPAPRFPYIEATNARVNIKLGEEKMPFSLTAADFALWLPTAQQWRVRLDATPDRTDANLSQTGTLRLEGTFDRAANLSEVPISLQASWHDAPLGQASALLTGTDAGWRGTLHIDTTLTGELGKARLTGHVTVDDLRRADFVPAQTLDVTANCQADANVTAATLSSANCTVPDGSGHAFIVATSAIDLQQPRNAPLRLEDSHLPLPWVWNWLKLFSARIPVNATPQGSMAVHLERAAQHSWSGSVQLNLPPAKAGAAQNPQTLFWMAQSSPVTDTSGCWSSLALAPSPLQITATNGVMLAGTISRCGYSLHASGQATEAELHKAARDLPQLLDGMPASTAKTSAPSAPRFDVTCTRQWGAGQSCIENAIAAPVKPKTKKHHHRR